MLPHYDPSEYRVPSDETGNAKIIMSDGTTFDVSKRAIRLCRTINAMLDDDEECPVIPLDEVDTEDMRQVIRFCEHFVNEEPMNAIPTPIPSLNLRDFVQPWYVEFALQFDGLVTRDWTRWHKMLNALNFLENVPMLLLHCALMARVLANKTPEQLAEAINEPMSEDDIDALFSDGALLEGGKWTSAELARTLGGEY